MEKEFIPYELALELKELGFDENCLAFYDKESKLIITGISKVRYSPKLWTPTFSQSFRWFREKYGDYLLYSFGVIPHFTIIQNLIIEDSKITYEEAELECLKKLIEIVKEKK